MSGQNWIFVRLFTCWGQNSCLICLCIPRCLTLFELWDSLIFPIRSYGHHVWEGLTQNIRLCTLNIHNFYQWIIPQKRHFIKKKKKEFPRVIVKAKSLAIILFIHQRGESFPQSECSSLCNLPIRHLLLTPPGSRARSRNLSLQYLQYFLWEEHRTAEFSHPPWMRNKSSQTQSCCSGGKGGINSL